MVDELAPDLLDDRTLNSWAHEGRVHIGPYPRPARVRF
jgi:hypothetical protein